MKDFWDEDERGGEEKRGGRGVDTAPRKARFMNARTAPRPFEKTVQKGAF